MGEFSKVVTSYNKLMLTVEGGRELVTMLTKMLDDYDNRGRDMEIPDGNTRRSLGGVDNLDILMMEDADIELMVEMFSQIAVSDHLLMEKRLNSALAEHAASQN